MSLPRLMTLLNSAFTNYLGHTIWASFSENKISQFSLISSHLRNWHKKSWAVILQSFKSSIIKSIVIQKKSSDKNCALVNFIIQECKFCKIARLFCVSAFLVRENLKELKGIFLSEKPGLYLFRINMRTWNCESLKVS